MKNNLLKPVLRYRGLLWRNELDRMLTASVLFSVAMIMVRILYTGRYTFLFLVWNLFLAYLPYLLTNWLQQRPGLIRNKWKFMALFGVWLLFIPNSFYIITDLFHLANYYTIPVWFDLALILSFAWNGLLLGILSVRQMEKMVQWWLPANSGWLFIYPIMWLNAFGMYIGRYLRFNSWDVVTNPFQLLADISSLLLHPVQNKFAWSMVCCFSILMTLIYGTLKKISKAIH